MWEEDFPTQTITVYEDPPERQSLVLTSSGEPYLIRKTVKIGFNLTPSGKQDAKKA